MWHHPLMNSKDGNKKFENLFQNSRSHLKESVMDGRCV